MEISNLPAGVAGDIATLDSSFCLANYAPRVSCPGFSSDEEPMMPPAQPKATPGGLRIYNLFPLLCGPIAQARKRGEADVAV